MSIAGDIPNAVKSINESLQFVREVKDEYDAAARAQRTADKPARPAPQSTMMSPQNASSSSSASGSSDNDGCGGCLLLLLLPAIGGAVAGPFGFVIGLVLAFMCADD